MLVEQLLGFPGLVTTHAFVDIAVAMVIAYVIANVILPVRNFFQRSKAMSAMAGSGRGHWFYGHLHEYPQNEAGMLGFWKDMHKFPAMFNYWIGPFFSLTQAFHPDINKGILGTAAPKMKLTYDFIRPWVGDGLLTTNGSKWKRHRKLITPAFHFNILKQYTATFADVTYVMLDKFSRISDSPIDVSKHLNLLTLDAILQCAMSSQTNCQLESVQENSYIHAVHEVSATVVKRIENPLLQMGFFFKLSSIGRRFYKSVEILHQNTAKIIRLRKEQLKNGGNEEINKKFIDFLDMLLRAKDEHGRGLTDEEIRDEVETFLFEGHDTTSAGLAWLFYNLARHPEIQERCRTEVNKVVNKDETINTSHLAKLPYLTMCIKESLRLHSPVYVIGRTMDEDLPVKCPHLSNPTSTIPKDTNVIVNIFTQHRNPLVWEQPHEFQPERFTEENFSKKSSHCFIPFSAGPRNCIGQNFAMNEMRVVMGETLRKFQLSIDAASPRPIFAPLLVLRSSSGIHIKLTPLTNI